MFTTKVNALAATLALSGALLAAGPASAATTLKGTVVHRNARAHSFVVANARGRLVAVHSSRSPRLGAKVVARVRKLRNGTYAAQRVRAHGHSRRVRLHGTVTFADRHAGTFVVSARGVSMLVHRSAASHAASAATATAAADTVPAPGTVVTVTGTLDPQGGVVPVRVQDDGTDTGTLDLEGRVLAVDTAARTLTLSADDGDSGAGQITVALPASFDLTMFAVGDEVEIVATLNQDGTYTAVGSSNDASAQQADDASGDQGDNSDQGDSGAQGDGGGGGDHSGSAVPSGDSSGSGSKSDSGSGGHGSGD